MAVLKCDEKVYITDSNLKLFLLYIFEYKTFSKIQQSSPRRPPISLALNRQKQSIQISWSLK